MVDRAGTVVLMVRTSTAVGTDRERMTVLGMRTGLSAGCTAAVASERC